MGRARRSGFSAILVLLTLAGMTIATASRPSQVVGAAAVGWPPSSLLVSEIATGGVSASDEFVELLNAGSSAVDLAGFEVVYATSSGSTVTQKASWTGARPLGPGQHLLIANSAGAYAMLGDATYSGGFSATGGAIALRSIGGATIDAIGWGDATNAFVEGSPPAAPPSGSSLERRPGGSAGNGTDTNENAVDWFIQTTPGPQNLASPPSPAATPTPPPTSAATPTPTLVPQPSASPTVSGTPGVCEPGASPTATPGPGVSPTPSTSPTPTPAPTVARVAIVDARALPIGGSVRVRGVVTAEAGRLGSAALLAIADESAGVVVRLAAGAIGPQRGTTIEVEGKLAAPYGQLEIRPPSDGIVVVGAGAAPEPLPIVSFELGEAVEGALVAVDVLIDKAPHRETNGSLTLDAADATTGGRLAIRADASSAIATNDLPRHARAHLVGIVGQRATQSGRLDGYRIWLRDGTDIVLTDPPGPSPTPSGSPSPTAPAATTVSIAQALLSPGSPVRVVGTVTAAGRLLDASGRVVVIQDATAAIAVRLPTGVATPRVGVRLRVDGSVGRAYGAPRIAATAALAVGTGPSILPLAIRTAPGAAHEWRLVRVEGEVVDVHKLGDRWRAEIAVGSSRLLISGLADSGLEATALVEGRRATVIGIVRRPYPTATDRRFAVVPRSTGDVRLGAPAPSSGAGGPATGSGSGANGAPGADASAGTGSGPDGPLDVDLATLAEHHGELVRVGGLVTAVESGAILLDDGTGIARILLTGDAVTLLGLLAPGDALDAVGRVRGTAAAPEIEVTSASDIARVGDPGPDPNGAATSGPDGSPVGRLGVGEGQMALLPADPSGPSAAAILIVLGGAILAGLAACVFVVRRRRDRQATTGRVAQRLAALTGGRSDELAPGDRARIGGA